MNKTKIILAGAGGAFGLGILATGYLVWGALSAKTAALEGDDEGTDGLETVVSKAETLSHKGVYPCAESVKALAANAQQLDEWKSEAFKLASRGDRAFKPTTSAAFKEFMVQDAKRLAVLPGGVMGALVKPEFEFGPFKDYITGGKMPADADVARLQRQWDDVVGFFETLSAAGVSEVTDLQFKGASPATDEQQQEVKPKKGRKNAKKRGDDGAKKLEPIVNGYVLTFLTRPTGLVKVVNAFETSERFVTVDDFTFVREKDAIVSALGGGSEKKGEEASGGGRRGRRGRGRAVQQEEQKEEAELKNGIITDPLLDAPLKVTMTLTVRDFKTLETKDEEEKK